MTSLNLLDNKLTSLPSPITALSMLSLNIGNNRLSAVPLCVCSFTTLQSLNLSDNPEITVLPAQMSQLSSLSHLNLKGLKKLKDPPKNIQMDCRKCISYLNEKLKKFTAFYEIKLIVVGYANRGKSTLVARLQGREGNMKKPSAGLNVSKWSYRPSVARRTFHFNVWDFGTKEECYAAQYCFLSQNAIYLVLFNLLHGKQAVEEIQFWLNTIAFHAPQSCVIIVGTHLDQIAEENRGPGKGDALLHNVSELAAIYKNRLLIAEILPVSLENRIENIGLLKEAIYNHAAKYQNYSDQLIMGQKVPASYHALVKRFEVIQQEIKQGLREPIMHIKEFKLIVNEMDSTDNIVGNDSELKKLTIFLTETGSLLHYDERGHGLHDLYFVDPSWLFEVISNTVIKGKGKIVANGILHSEDFGEIIQDQFFPWKYGEQYTILLDRFEIVLPLDNRRLLMPSTLPEGRKFSGKFEELNMYSRCFLFSSATPPGFWSRLLIHCMYTVEKISFVLDEAVPIKVNQYEGNGTSMHPNLIICPNSQPEQPSLTNNRAWVLPNFPQPRHLELFHSFDTKEIHLEFWQRGLYYSDPEVTFKIESLVHSRQTYSKQSNSGILILASRNTTGIKAISQLANVVTSLIREWYPYLQKYKHGPQSNDLKQRVLCSECVKLRQNKPFEFDIEHCLQAIVDNKTTVECGYFQGDPRKNHCVAIEDIAPDLLFQDINSEYFLCSQDIIYQENEASLLGKGGYAEVYQGTYKGKKSIAIKKYLSRFSEQILCDFHFEAKIHCQLQHPCIVDFIGVCVQPLMTLVLEKAPLNSASYPFLENKAPISRLTVFRIATEVAAALRFMHRRRIVYRDVKAANVLLWTLDPDSLCHSKLCDLNIAAHLSPTGIRGFHGCKGFTAPEVIHTVKGKYCSLYDHRADIFSFGMFLYQMISRRNPYHNIPTYRIDTAIENGERPKYPNNSYYYLTQLMEKCWDGNPANRPDTDEIIKNLCISSMQTTMCMIPLQSKCSIRQAVSISTSDSESQNDLWMCCDGVEGVEIRVYNIHTMIEVKRIDIEDNQIQCVVLCGDHAWIATRAGVEYGVIDIRNTETMESEQKIYMHNKSTTFLTATNETVYIGTSDGDCISYQIDVNRLKNDSIPPKENHISDCAIDGIVCTDGNVWISHTNNISYLDLETLNIRGTITLENSSELEQRAHVGQLACGVDHILWGAHVGGTLLSAWNTQAKCHLYSINIINNVKRVTGIANDHNLVLISAMTTALDTVWVGMASGHILIFYQDYLLSWFHPFEDYVRFLACIPSSDPNATEKCMVASGGKNIKPLLPLCKSKHRSDGPGGTSHVVIWEAYDAKTMRRIKLIEEGSPEHLDNYEAVCRLIKEGDFKDGTNLCSFQDENLSDANDNLIYTNCIINQKEETGATEELHVQLLNPRQTAKLICSKPVKLDSVMNELQLMVNLDDGQLKQLAYCVDGAQIELKTQADLETYLTLSFKPPILVIFCS